MQHRQQLPLVAIKCMTYNHGLYIGQCLEGFVMQETNFPFLAIVHDDASTDNTAEIIREYAERYPDIIKPIYESENQYSKHDGSIRKIMENAIPDSVKYIALCEGDDYWTDPNKLQLQVDFLERNADYGLVHTDFDIINETSIQEFRYHKNFSKIKDVQDALLIGAYGIGTLTVLFRKSIYDNLPRNNVGKGWPMGDLPMWIEMSSTSKFKYLNISTACYRRISNSASHNSDIEKRIAFIRNAYDCRKYYATLYNKSKLIKLIDRNCDVDVFKVIAKEGKDNHKTAHVFYSLIRKYNLIGLPFNFYCYYLYVAFPFIKKVLTKLKLIESIPAK